MSKVDSRFEPGLGDTCDWSHRKSDSLANMTKIDVKPWAQDLGKERVLKPPDHTHETPAQPSALPSRASAETQSPGPRRPPLHSMAPFFQPPKAKVHRLRKTRHHLLTEDPGTRTLLTPRGSPTRAPPHLSKKSGSCCWKTS